MKNLKIVFYLLMIFSASNGVIGQNCAQLYYYGTGLNRTFVDTNVCTWGSGFLLADPRKTTWDFGDSSALDTGRVVNYTFPGAGYYFVEMTVYDTLMTNSEDTTILVAIGSPPPMNCAIFSKYISHNNVFFQSNSGCINQNNYLWDYGDGNTGTGQTSSHSYSALGTYYVTLYVYFNTTLLDSAIDSVTITSFAPINCADFSSVISTNVVTFTDLSYCSNINSYNWDFGDGNFGIGTNPSHTYTSSGNYLAILTLLDSGSNIIDTAMGSITIGTPPALCNASFTKSQPVDTFNNPIPGHIVVYNTSSGLGLSYFWDFGDGNTSSLSSPTHTYTGNGPYILCLTISNSSSCLDTYCDTLSVDSNGNILRRAPGFTVHVGGYNPLNGVTKSEFQGELTLYPNPIDDVIHLKLEDFIKGNIQILLSNELGQIVYQESIQLLDSNYKTEISANEMTSGIYFLLINSEKGSIARKVIKQ